MLVNAAKSYFLGPVKLVVKVAFILVAMLIAGFIYIALTLDLNPYKPQIEQQASEAMGRPVRIMGDLDWGISWFRPSIVLNKIIVGNAAQPEATLGKLSFTVPLSELIAGNISAEALPGKIDLVLKDLVYEGQEIGNITAPVRFNAEGLSIVPLTIDLPHDGTLKADVAYHGNKLTVSAKAEDIDYALIIPGASGGNLGGTLDLDGVGATIDDVLTGLNGKVALSGGEGRLSGDAISLWASDLLSRVMTGTKKHTDVTCLLLKGDIRRGIFTPAQAVLDTDSVLVRATGSIDLGRQRLKLLVTPSPKDAALISLATPLNVEGSWDNPSVKPDKRAMLEKVGGLMLSVVVPPAALLSFAQKGDNSSPCTAAAARKP